MGIGSEANPARAPAYVIEYDGAKFVMTGALIEVLHLGNPLPPFALAWVHKLRERWFIISADA